MSYRARLKAMRKLIPHGSKWRHYRDSSTTYVVRHVGYMTGKMELMIVYGDEGTEDIWIRHHSEWFDEIDGRGRFSRIDGKE